MVGASLARATRRTFLGVGLALERNWVLITPGNQGQVAAGAKKGMDIHLYLYWLY